MNQINVKIPKESSHQYTNIVGIDPSTTVTGICINGELSAVTRWDNAHTKKEALVKWYKITQDYAELSFIAPRTSHKQYALEELSKLEYYTEFKDKIISKLKHLDPKNTIVLIEGYSYSSQAGHIIDLVTFSTLIRSELLKMGFELMVVSPSTLKLNTAKMVYQPTTRYLNKKKTRSEEVWINNEGVSGGKFTKNDMFTAIVENSTESNWKNFLKEYYSDLSEVKNIPKPIEDLNDAFLLYSTMKAGLYGD